MKKSKDYIVFPLDVPSGRDAMRYVDALADHVGLFKVGLELFISEGPKIVKSIADSTDAGIFLDLKLHDIPITVRRALVAASLHRPRFVTVHCDEANDILGSGAEENLGDTRILAITVLTSLNQEKLRKLGYAEEFANHISRLVLLRARMAKAAGCHGVVCSGHEVADVREEIGPQMIIVTPGIRPAWSLVDKDDQERIVTPADAIKNGSDYVVIGRPIRDAEDPRDAAVRVADEIELVLYSHAVNGRL